MTSRLLTLLAGLAVAAGTADLETIHQRLEAATSQFEKVKEAGCDGDSACEESLKQMGERLQRSKLEYEVMSAQNSLEKLKAGKAAPAKSAAAKKMKAQPAKVHKRSPAPALERAEELSERFDQIKAKIEASPELKDDDEVQSALKRIDAKFERLAGDDEEEEEDKEVAEMEAAEKAPTEVPEMERAEELSDRFDQIKAKIEASPELKGNKEIQSALKRIDAKFERLAGDDEEEEEDKEVAEMEAAEKAPKEVPEMERAEELSDRFHKIKAKIEAAPELKNDEKVQSALKRIDAKFERLAAPAGAVEGLEREAGGDVDAEALPAEALRARLAAVQSKIMSSPALKGDSHVMAGLQKVMTAFERAEAVDTDEADAERAVAPAKAKAKGAAALQPVALEDHEAMLERVQERFNAIQRKIKNSPKLGKDQKVQAALKQVTAKFKELKDADTA